MNNGLSFCYSLLGCAVYTEPFQDLDNPEFLAERAAAKVRATTENIAKYFQQHPTLQIHLVVGDLCLATAKVDLTRFTQITSTEQVIFDMPCELLPVPEGGVRPKYTSGTSIVAVTLALSRTDKNPNRKNTNETVDAETYSKQEIKSENPSNPMQVDQNEEFRSTDGQNNEGEQESKCLHVKAKSGRFLISFYLTTIKDMNLFIFLCFF